ncbi:MAG: hypothetical protein HY920_08025 [Elusimicrobia bacterium]|nr:hypothetical protein [Elusimicrobiota bacterium]
MPKALKLVLKIREKEVLRYLKYDLAKTKADSSMHNLVREQIKTGAALARPGLKYKIFPILSNNGQKVTLPDFIIENKNIARRLKSAEKAVLFVTTIGPALEQEINRLFAAAEPTKAVILDAVGSEGVEVLCDRVQEAVTRKAGSYQATPRFSPGYAAWPLKINKTILKLLDAQIIRVNVSSKFMLIPQKTVTGIWGLVRNNKK